MPDDDELVRIAYALGKSPQDARKILAVGSKLEEREQILAEEFWGFQQWLISRPKPVHVFVVREDAEPVDEFSITLHYEILRIAKHLKISILFRYSDRKTWASFRRLAEAVKGKWSDTHENSDDSVDDLNDRISGYYRNPKFEEKRDLSMPLAQPAVIVVDPTSPYLFFYGYHPHIYINQKQAIEDYLEHYKNPVLITAPKEKAQLFIDWIELEDLSGRPSAELWQQIEWPPNISDTSE